MLGPGIAAYLILSVALFATGAFGVLIRRSPLIILLALELMLNAGNLALIAFARQLGNADGQIFALTVMVVAAAEAVLGLGLIVAVSRKRVELDVDRLTSLRGWPGRSRLDALFSPAVAVVAIALLGERIDRRSSGLLASGATFLSFVCTAALFFQLLGREPENRSILSTPWTWLTAGDLIRASVLIARSPSS